MNKYLLIGGLVLAGGILVAVWWYMKPGSAITEIVRYGVPGVATEVPAPVVTEAAQPGSPAVKLNPKVDPLKIVAPE